jgi:hypothetical protein
MSETVVADERGQLRADFIREEKLTDHYYRKLKQQGLAPDELILPGTNLVWITPAAKARWRERLEAYLVSDEAKLAAARDAERRTAQARKAGKASVKSLKHISKKKTRPRRKKA